MAYISKIKIPPEARKALDDLNHLITDIYDSGGMYIYLARSNADKKTSLCLIAKAESGRKIEKYADISDVRQIDNLIRTVRKINEHDTAK